jgi:hypothetical protein
MSLAKKCDTRDRLSAGRGRSQHSFRPASRADRTNSIEMKPDGAQANRMSFAEDFLLEHTHSSLRIAFVGRTPSSATAPREQQMSAQCYGFPS